jgi:two-component system response regulator
MKSSLSVLLVEDDAAHAEITRRNIEELGASLTSFVHVRDGQAAMDHLEAVRVTGTLPDLILLDLRLPRLDGLEVLSRVKSDSKLKRIPVVVLTTSEAEQDVNSAYERGANSYLVKPVDHAEYLALTRTLSCYWFGLNRVAHS